MPGRKPPELARAVAQEIARISQPALEAITPQGGQPPPFIVRLMPVMSIEYRPTGVAALLDVFEENKEKAVVEVAFEGVPRSRRLLDDISYVLSLALIPNNVEELDAFLYFFHYGPEWKELPESVVGPMRDAAAEAAKRLSQLAGREVKVEVVVETAPATTVYIHATPSGAEVEREKHPEY